MKKECSTCEFNFGGKCAGHGNVYKYGETIVDDTKVCDDWGAGLEYFTYQLNTAPRFLRDAHDRCHISYSEFSTWFDDFQEGKPVPINFFDAIKMVYGLSMVDIAVLLDVSYGVVYRAKTTGFAAKRIKQFANVLCVPEKLLLNTTTADFEELSSCKEAFFQSNNVEERLQGMPEWRQQLAQEISSILRCPIHIAKKISRVDFLLWKKEHSLEQYTETEIEFINYAKKICSKQGTLNCLEYFLNVGAKPHISVDINQN